MRAVALALALVFVCASPVLASAARDDDVLYFVMVDRFFDGDATNAPDAQPGVQGKYWGGDLEGLRQKLDYLADLGVTKVWITPLYDQVDAPVGNDVKEYGYHGYWAESLVDIEPRWGNDAVLKRLLEDARARGIGIVLDVVLNHVGYGAKMANDARLVRSRETKTCPSESEQTEITMCLFGLPDLRTELPEVRKLVVDAAASWVEHYPFAGFRLDTYKHIEPDIFAELTARAKKTRGDDFLVLAESFGLEPGEPAATSMLSSGAADTAFDFAFVGLAQGLVMGRMRGEALMHHLDKRHDVDGPPLAHFLDSHDVPTFVHLVGGERNIDRYPLAAVLQMTVRGIPVVTWGNEVARAGGPWPENRSMMPWTALSTTRGRSLHDTWRALIKLRRASPALTGRNFTPLAARSDVNAVDVDDNEAGRVTLAYLRGDPTRDREVFIVALASGEPLALDAALPFSAKGARVELAFAVGGDVDAARAPAVSLALTSSSSKSGGDRLNVRLARDSAAIWRVRLAP